MKTYLVMYNELNMEIGKYPMDTRNDLTKEVIRILVDEDMILNEGDKISIEQR